MNAQPFDVGLIVARLTTPLPGALRFVGGSADYASVNALGDFPAPCAYVLLARETGTDVMDAESRPGVQIAMAQLVRVNFAVVLAFRNYRQLGGAELRDELRDQVGAVRARLLGWTPPMPGGLPCAIVQGDLTAYDAGTAVWTDVWRTQHLITSEIS